MIAIKSKINRLAFFTIIILFWSNYLPAQNSDKPLKDIKLKELKGLAKNALRLGDGYTALYYYVEWSNRKPKNNDLIYQVAELYNYTRNYKAAEEWFKRLAISDPQKYPLSVFYLARSQMAQSNYTIAKANFLVFKKLVRYVDDPYFRDQYKKGILSCDYAIQMKDSIDAAVTIHLDQSINKPHVEFSPVVLDQNTLLYGSLSVEGLDYYDIDAEDSIEMPLRKFYTAKKIGDDWIGQGEFQGPFNQEDLHIGNATLSHDGSKMYFTICQKNWKNAVVCHLYYSEKKSSTWSEPVAMNEAINTSNFTTTQPAIGFDSRNNAEIVYFVSDRPGGRGGLDIWYTEFNPRRNSFKTPKNAGSKINGKGDEVTPYYDRNTRQLYFSSNGKVGYGGQDVYKTTGEKRRWEVAEVLGKGINSPYDDLDFTLNHDKSGGFLVSNRKGGTALLSETCCDDIYAFTFSKFIKINLTGKTIDSTEFIQDFQLSFYLTDTAKGQKILLKKMDVKNYDFNFDLDQGYNYTIEISKKGYYKNSIDISTVGIEKTTTLSEIIPLEPIPSEPFILKGILYEFDSDKLTENAKLVIDTTLIRLMTKRKNIVIQISSHTDSKGKEDYNLNLSKRRARSVIEYLMVNGISPDRLRSEGYGENVPIAPNQNEDGTDNSYGRSLNRRTEFTILSELEYNAPKIENEDGSKKSRKKRISF